jgi:hypothetical protein
MPADKPPYSATTPTEGDKPQWEDPAAKVAREIKESYQPGSGRLVERWAPWRAPKANRTNEPPVFLSADDGIVSGSGPNMSDDRSKSIDELLAGSSAATQRRPELPGTKTLDYVGLGLVLAPPAVVLDMYLKGTDINWRRVAIATVISWIAGAIAVWASHRWSTWRGFVPRLLPYLATFENKFWGKAIIIASAMGLALILSSVLSKNEVAPQTPVAQTGTFAETYTLTAADAHKIRDEIFKIRDLLPSDMLISTAYDYEARNVADRIFTGMSLAGIPLRGTPVTVNPLTPQETGISIRVGDLSKIPNNAKALAQALKNALGVEPRYTAMQGLHDDQFLLFVGTNPKEN